MLLRYSKSHQIDIETNRYSCLAPPWSVRAGDFQAHYAPVGLEGSFRFSFCYQFPFVFVTGVVISKPRSFGWFSHRGLLICFMSY